MGCCGRKRRRSRTKKADALTFLYKVAKQKNENSNAKSIALDSLGILGGGILGQSVSRGITDEIMKPYNGKVVAKANNIMEKAKKFRDMHSKPVPIYAVNPTPIDIAEAARMSVEKVRNAQGKYNVQKARVIRRLARYANKRAAIVSLMGAL